MSDTEMTIGVISCRGTISCIKNTIVATIKQKATAKEMVKVIEGKQNKTAGEILENVGYSEGICENPKVVLESKGYQEVLNEYLPDDLLAEKHKELLTVPKIIKTTKRGELIDSEESLDVQAISKGLDMAYKVKGSYAPEKKQSVNLYLNTKIKNLKESKDLVDEYEAKLKNMLKEPKTTQ